MNLAIPIVVGLAILSSALIAAPALVVEWVKRSSPDVVFQVPVEERVVALTIDDGPSESTREILGVLEEHGAKATFFVIGSQVEAYPELAREMVEAGHELGHHMMEDVPSLDLPEDQFQERFQEMDRILEGYGGSWLFRPASGWYHDDMVEFAQERGYLTVLGSVYPFDAHVPSSGFASWYVRQHAGPGDILVLHEGLGRGVRTIDALRTILPELKERGYQVVSVSHLMALAVEGDVGSPPPLERGQDPVVSTSEPRPSLPALR